FRSLKENDFHDSAWFLHARSCCVSFMQPTVEMGGIPVISRTIARALVMGAFATLSTAAFSATIPIDLNTWEKRGPSANGNWTVTPDGSSVFQSINGDPTFFVSPDNQINKTIRGSIRVETTTDDDYIGFVFGFN